jgi:hypothetical protein
MVPSKQRKDASGWQLFRSGPIPRCSFQVRAYVEAEWTFQERMKEEQMVTILIIVLLVVALGGGGWGYSRYGTIGFSPAGLILLVLLIMWLTGNLHVH